MTLVSDIIRRAYRENNVIAIGVTPTTEEATEGLEKLVSLVKAIYGNEIGENLNPFPLGNFGRSTQSRIPFSENMLNYPPINATLIVTNELAKTVYMPVNPSDGSRISIIDPMSRLASVPVTLDGNGRAIEGNATLLLDTNGMNRTWFYRADLGNWVRVIGFTEADAFPFPEEFDDYFIITLAMRINPAFAISMDEQSVARLRQQKQQLVARYVQSAPLEAPADLSFMSRQSYETFANGWFGNSTADWQRGGPF